MALTTTRVEKEYDQVHARTVQLLDAERGRVQCMEQLLLRIEIESLQSRVNQAGQELIQAREAESEACLQLDGAIGELERLQVVAQASSREIEYLRRELASSNTVASDSQKLQSEKVRLSKEVSSIQSEVERLRSQNTSANVLLAEKQALTRQLDALELQLEDEKRAHERTSAKGSQQTEEVAALTSKLEEARWEIELARRQKQGNAQQKGRLLMAHQSPLVGKDGGFNQNLRAAKGCRQEDTPDSQQEQESWGSTTTKVPTERPGGNRPPKPSGSLHSELTIATPGAVRAQNQRKRVSTMPGVKSSFSITPFLNRTTGLEESTMSSDDELSELRSVGDDSHLVHLSNSGGHGNNTETHPKQLKPPATKQPHKPGKQSITKGTLDGDARNRQKQNMLNSPDEVGGYGVPLSLPAGQKQAQSKKRKLGLQRDRSLFDEDEGENALQDTKKPGRKPAGANHTSLAGNRAFNGPAGFSPLKRDRKRF
ncbi:hypothetical protein BDW59DRAFT_76884 [Aspergillus cavernicola]|uniref:Uncharacterized protein n=1 Tax=Aspergillus cavernicola TaxID=176166 RepID=A0ABR4IZS5_9EURO